MTRFDERNDPDAVVYVMRVVWDGSCPELELRDGAGMLARRERVPAIGYRLRYRVDPTGARACLGYAELNGGAPVECNRSPEPGNRRCDACQRKDIAFSVNLHQSHTRGTAELHPDMVEHLRQPNVLYVAGFGDGSTKIGTSTEHRWATRLAEQGAWRARVIARTENGIAVRRAEDLITTDLGVGQAVSAPRKLAGITAPIGPKQLASTVDEVADAAQHLVADELAGTIEAADSTWTNSATAAILDRTLRPIEYPATITEGAHDFTIENMIGRMALARRPDGEDLFVIDLGQLYGLELGIGEWEPEPIAIQGSLFG